MGFFKIACPKCGAENKKDSRFCSKCGFPLESKNTASTCPSCGAEISAGAHFCPQCGAQINAAQTVERTAATKEQGKNREWVRHPGDFAQRFEIADLKAKMLPHFFSKKLTIEQGERAIFVEGGVYKGALSAGVYTFGTIYSQFNLNNRASLIIVDAGAVQLKFDLPELRTKNSILVSASGKITAQIQNFLAFLENYLKYENHVSLDDISRHLEDELKFVAQNIVINYTAEELVGNAKIASELESNFKTALNEGFGKTGIEILAISFIGFKEGAWREVTEERGKLSVETGKARAEFERKATIRSLETADAVDEIENKGAVANAAQEVTHRLDDNELDHALGKDSRIFEHEQEKRKQRFEENLYKITQLKQLQLEKKKQRLEIERENERLTLENRSNTSVEALISILGGDDETAKQIAKLELEKRAASLTTEQILAIQSTDPTSAAEALKAKYSAEEQKEFNIRTEEMGRENTDNMKEVMNTALNAMGSTATARATAQNPGATVVAGGLGAPVVVNQQAGKKCPKCGASLDADDVFCPECGERVN